MGGKIQSDVESQVLPIKPVVMAEPRPATRTIGHEPREIARTLHQLISSPTKKIGFLTGAGTSVSVRVKRGDSFEPLIPDVTTLTRVVEDCLTEVDHKTAFEMIRGHLQTKHKIVHIEHILSLIRMKIQVLGDEKLCGLPLDGFMALEKCIQDKIAECVAPVDIPSAIVHEKMAKWIKNARRHNAVEIFTTNYDLLFEIGFERTQLPFFDGFVGSYEPFFYPMGIEENELLPANWVRLWKIHGSLGWKLAEDGKRIVKSPRNQEEHLLVYPSILKYDDSKKQPYLSFIDRLGSFLRQSDSFLIVTGYSFGDQHINEVILNALARSHTASVYAFIYDELHEGDDVVRLAQQEHKLSILGPNAAVLGGQYREWRLNREPSKAESIQVSSYFDEDAIPALEEVDSKLELGGTEHITIEERTWQGTGRFKLVDFKELVNFMQLVIDKETS